MRVKLSLAARRDRRRRARRDSRASGTDRSTPRSACRRQDRRCRSDCRWTAAPDISLCPPRCAWCRRRDVGPVEEIGDAAETFRLALRAENPLRGVEALERRVVRRRNLGDDLQREVRGHRCDGQRFVAHVVFGRRQALCRRWRRKPVSDARHSAPAGTARTPCASTFIVAVTRVARGSSTKSSAISEMR